MTVASKLEETPFDAPSSVTVFTAEEIRGMGITTVQELLNFVPGYQALRNIEDSEAHAVSVRGRRGSFAA